MMISRSKYRSSVEVCADCGASEPTWASINRGLLLCTECCSVHRSLGRHISHVKSLKQGTWPPSLLAMVQALTAQNVNSIWEHSLLDASAPKHLKKKPNPRDPLHPVKSEFILAKHLRLAYVLRARRDEPPSELGRQLHSAVRSGSLDTAMRLLAQGADPNYYNQEKGSHCVHVACRAGQAAQAELLVAWGADPAPRDREHHTPEQVARLAGHTELASRMVELVHSATDRLIQFLTGAAPDHAAGRHFLVPPARLALQMTDVAKAARGKLQLLPNHLFEELVMDIYDEIDRRETEAIWQSSATGLERSGVVFLPVNPALSAPRNQGRQKLARLSTAEMATLLRDVLVDATRRQHIATLQPRSLVGPGNPLLSASHLKHFSQLSDDEPLYDSVASDDDYACLAPELDMGHFVSRTDGNIASTYSASLPTELSLPELRRTNSPPNPDVAVLKKELDNKECTISELKSQLKNLQTIVEQLTKENSVLKTSSVDDELSTASQLSMSEMTDVVDTPKIQERGKSLDSEHIGMCDPVEVRTTKSAQRPVSMFEAREGPRNNWQVTKHQLTTLPALQRTLSSAGAGAGGAGAGAGADAAPPAADITRGAEAVTRAIQSLWAAARGSPASLPPLASSLRAAVAAFTLLFPQQSDDHELNLLLNELQMACDEVIVASSAPSPLNEVRSAAYELAKATKLIVTHYQPDS